MADLVVIVVDSTRAKEDASTHKVLELVGKEARYTTKKGFPRVLICCSKVRVRIYVCAPPDAPMMHLSWCLQADADANKAKKGVQLIETCRNYNSIVLKAVGKQQGEQGMYDYIPRSNPFCSMQDKTMVSHSFIFLQNTQLFVLISA